MTRMPQVRSLSYTFQPYIWGLNKMEFQNQQVRERQLPRFAHVSYTPLARRFALLRLGVVTAICLLTLAVATGIATIVHIVEPELLSVPGVGNATTVIWMVLMSIVFLMVLPGWFVFASARVIRYALREHDIIMQSGLFWKKEIIQPLKRVQHVEVTRGPLDKRFGIANVKLFSAGTGLSTFRIPGLEESLAERIRQYVLNYQEASTRRPSSLN